MMMKLIGEDGVAAITIIIYSQFLLTSLYIGFSMGVAPIISYNYGSENNTQLNHVFKICILFISVASLLVFIFSISCSPIIVEIFSQRGSRVYEIARSGFYIFSFSFIFVGIIFLLRLCLQHYQMERCLQYYLFYVHLDL